MFVCYAARLIRSRAGRALVQGLNAPDLVEALNDWIDQRRKAPTPGRAGRCLLDRVIQGDADFLRFATAESLAYLQWLTSFADAQRLTDVGGTNHGPGID